MVAEKSERLLNLLIMLLVQRHFVSKDRIRAILYPDSGDDAFEKMFERDKEDLRAIGVPIEVGQMDAYFDDEPGYRVRPDVLQIPRIELEADEAAVVALATKVWEHARLAQATTEAVRKLTAYGLPIDVSALDVVEPRLGADEPSFDVFWEATQERQPVEFEYQRRDQRQPTTRHLQPWGVVRYSGRWYAVGHDTDRERGAGLPPVAGRRRGPAGREGRFVRRACRGRHPRDGQAARSGALEPGSDGAGARGSRARAAPRRPRASATTCPVPTRPPAGTASRSSGAVSTSSASSCPTGPTSSSRPPPSCRRGSWSGCARSADPQELRLVTKPRARGAER